MSNQLDFSSEEKQAIYQILCAMAIIDKSHDCPMINYEEKVFIEHVVKIIEMTENDRVSSRTIKSSRHFEILKSMNMTKKSFLAINLAQLAIVDGNVSTLEIDFFQYCLNLLNLPFDPDDLY